MTSTIKKWVMIGMVGLTTLCVASPAVARSISFKDAGVALWIFVVIGAVIVLLQLIPAAILFFSFIGTTSAVVFKGKNVKEEKEAEVGVLTEVETAKAK
jgi:high-affinity Fe2+/Pb2+ permease